MFPKHIEMTIRHNPHAADYEPLETWIERHLRLALWAKVPADEAIQPADLAAIRATGELWVMTWHPNSPVGSCDVVAASFERLLELARE